jgi:hypothetical protein
MILADAHCRTEDIAIVSVVIAELKLGDVQRQILSRNLVKCADNTALKDGPKALNRVCVNGTHHILPASMVNDRVGVSRIQPFIANPLIRAEQANFLIYTSPHKALKSVCADVLDHTGYNAPFSADSARYDRFAGTHTARSTGAALVPMFVLFFSTNKRFVYFHNAHQFLKALVGKASTNAVAHIMRCFVRAEAHHALDLKGRNTFLADEHKVDDLEPHKQIDVRILKDGADKVREAVGRAYATIHALPLIHHRFEFKNAQRAAARAVNAVGPTFANQVRIASSFIWEKSFKLQNGKLMNFGHGSYLSMIKAN